MKNILVLTDFSHRAKCAAEYAMNIAISIKANLIICHALEISERITYPLADHLVLKNQSMKRLKEIGMHLSDIINSDIHDFEPAISYTNDLDMLTEVAINLVHERSVEFVVIGSHPSNSISQFFFGSHTNDILDAINCPVLLVPEGISFRPVKGISYATDLTFNNTRVIDFLSKLAKPFGAEILVNHISPFENPLSNAEEAIEAAIIEQINTEARVSYKTIKGSNVPKGLIELSNIDKIDILVLVHQRYAFFEGLFHTSISKQLAHSTKIPLLIMPFSYSCVEELSGSANK